MAPKAMSLLKSGSTAPSSNWTNAGKFPNTAAAVNTMRKAKSITRSLITVPNSSSTGMSSVCSMRHTCHSPLRGTNVGEVGKSYACTLRVLLPCDPVVQAKCPNASRG